MTLLRCPRSGSLRLVLLVLLAAASASTSTLAADGVLEINHTCATTTGCFAGDSAGYPVTIDGAAGRSYRLTSDLRLPTNTNGIEIRTSHALVDLGGFSIIRDCRYAITSGVVVICIRGNSGHGVVADDPGDDHNEVRNGSIAFLGGDGVVLGEASSVSQLRIFEVGGRGVRVEDGSSISQCVVESSGDIGLSAASAVIEGNTVRDSGSHGIGAGVGSTVRGNHVFESGASGITGSGLVVEGNMVQGSTGDGISASSSAVVGNVSRTNGGLGVSCNRCTATSNALTGNTGAAIGTVSFGGYGQNTIQGSVTVTGSMSQTATNVCNGNTVCP